MAVNMETSDMQPQSQSTSLNSYLLQLSERNRHFSKWLDDTAIEGIVHVFKEKSLIRRVIWGLIFFVAVFFCLYNIGDRASYYASSPSSTTLSVSNKDSVPFPAVTICNLNPIKKSVAEQLNIADLLKLYYQSNTVFFYTRPHLLYTLNLSTNEPCNSYLNVIDNSTQSMTLHDLYVNGAFNSSELIQLCFFGQEYTICNDMFEPIITHLGLCYSINTNATLFSRTPGVSGGLYVLINIQANNYIASLDGTAGVKVLVHSKDVLPDPVELGIAISPGKSAYISFNEEITNDETGNGCSETGEVLKYFPNYHYSLVACRTEIYAEAIVEQCNCIHPFVTVNISTDIRLCTIGDLCCIKLAFESADASSCVPICLKTDYPKSSVSYAQFPDESIIHEFQSLTNATSEHIKSNLVTAHIYFKDLTVTKIETIYSYSFSAFLSDIGGQLGLLIGASVISIIEIGILLLDICKDTLVNCHPKKEKSFAEVIEMNTVSSKPEYTY